MNPQLNDWFGQLQSLACEYGCDSEAELQKHLAALAIAIEASPKSQDSALAKLLFRLHQAQIIEQMLALLRDIEGYYHLIDYPAGQNEPPVGSGLALKLKSELRDREESVYELKDALAKQLLRWR